MVNIKELNEDLELAIKKTQEANIENEGEEKFIKIPLGSTVLLAEVMALDDRGDEESLNALSKKGKKTPTSKIRMILRRR